MRRWACPFKSENVNLEKEIKVGMPEEAPRAQRFFWRGGLSWVLTMGTNISTNSPCSHPSLPVLPKWCFLNSNLVLLSYGLQCKVQTPDHGVHSPSPTFCPLLVCPTPTCLPPRPPHIPVTHSCLCWFCSFCLEFSPPRPPSYLHLKNSLYFKLSSNVSFSMKPPEKKQAFPSPISNSFCYNTLNIAMIMEEELFVYMSVLFIMAFCF